MFLLAKLVVDAHYSHGMVVALEEAAPNHPLPCLGAMGEREMEEDPIGEASTPVPSCSPQSELEDTSADTPCGQGCASHTKEPSDVTETLFITPVEQNLWNQLVGILSPSHWEVKVSGGLQEGSGVLSFSGSPQVVVRAKESISKLLILVGSLVGVIQVALPQTQHRAAGFFHLCEGHNLFLWEGDPSKFRVDGTMRIGAVRIGLGQGNAVFVQRALSQRGSPHFNLDVSLSHPPRVDLAAGAVKLALEAASQRGLQSLVMSCYSGLAVSTTQAEAMAVGIEAFQKEHPDSSLKSISFVFSDREAVAMFCKECGKHWPPGNDGRERLRNILLSLEGVRTEVVTDSSPRKKTDVAVLPLVLASDGLEWSPSVLAITQKALQAAPHAKDLQPGEVLPVMTSSFPELNCKVLYMVRLARSQLRLKEAYEAIWEMVWSCLSIFCGSFLESISFPFIQPADPDLALKQEYLLVILKAIDCFLKEVPNTWMKLVQIVPLPEETLFYPVGVSDSITTDREPLGFCYLEDPLFLRYLNEDPVAFHQFEAQLKEVGYGIQTYPPWRMLMVQATVESMELHNLEAAFWSVRNKYVVHCETRTEMLDALLEELTLLKEFRSIRMYMDDKMWFVGLSDEMVSLLHGLAQGASRRQLVSRECPADEPLPRCAIVKDFVIQEMLSSNPLVSIEILAKAPATIQFWGRSQRVEEAERRFKELLSDFQALPVPLSDLQFQFVKALWGKLFHNYFFLEQGIPVLLEISEVVQVSGLDLGKMKEVEEFIMERVCERTVEIAEELKWATECDEWKELLQRLESHEEIALHHTASNQVTVVGTCPHVTQVEESIKEYLRDNSPVEEKIEFARPELAAAGSNLLRIMDWEHLNVSVKFQPDGQVLYLQVSGLQKDVKKAIPTIRIDLDSLVLCKMPLKKKAFGEYFSGVGAGLLKGIVQRWHCVANLQIREIPDRCSRVISNDGCSGQGSTKEDHPVVFYALGREDYVVSLKQAVAGLFAKFHACSICSEAITTFSDQILDELCKNTLHRFPIGLWHPRNDKLQICGFQEDVLNVLEVIHKKIEEYQAGWIEIKAQYETLPCIIVKEYLVQGILPFDPLVSTDILAENPATVTFKGPRWKVIESQRHFELLLRGFQVLPVPLSDLQSQFVKAQWGKLFHNSYFFEQGILAALEISEVVHVAGLDLGTMKEAEEILMRYVCEKTVEIAQELQWATQCEEWKELLQMLRSNKQTAIHHVVSSQVTVVGISPHIVNVEECIKEYLRDNSPTEEKVNITKPEIVVAGDNLLRIMGWHNLNVHIQVQSDSQVLCLQVCGLCKYVREAIPAIRVDLDSLELCSMPLKTAALGEYFSGTGASLLQEMAQQQDCIARVQIQGSADDNWAVIHAVGRESDIASLKQDVANFIAKFRDETICSAEISTFNNKILEELCENTSHCFPVALRRLREKVVWVCGSQEDVENILEAIYTKIEKAVNAKMQKAQAAWIDSKLLYESVQWRYKTDAGWSTFDMATNSCLERSYGEKQMRTWVLWKGQMISVNLLKGEAFMPENGKTFTIMREICLWDKNIVPHWEAMQGSLVKKVELETSSEEYRDVVKKFKQTSTGYKVLKVERIQNQYLWISYCCKRTWMEKKNSAVPQNERILYHGTQPKHWCSIHEIGFKSACRNTGFYGQGIYFSSEASLSAYYAEPDSNGHRYMFQARVLIGEYAHGNENMVLPPKKPWGRGRYDSLVNDTRKPTIFVTFFDDHAYPEYLITFC
ncbi:uncharacterized protein LOC128328864 isoform X2 [Hemicordylus capensis]|uniref:uncharacterized protein LOC128328864 isoform X2 n=1 Tax=Hemicordylus capensis TaxID=884348 RepID=UPI002302FD06|nr:uncharacterized protein LOC128328864 isoform X2 [Hemicordylus capensis]